MGEEKKLKWTRPSLKNITETLKDKGAEGQNCANGSGGADNCISGTNPVSLVCETGTGAQISCVSGDMIQ